MIDPNLFTVDKLLKALLGTEGVADNEWRTLAEIIPNYVAPFAREGDQPRCVVRLPKFNSEYYSFLRHSKGPRQCYFWDIYGDDFHTSELALLALIQSPVPPYFISADVWRAVRDAKILSRM